MRLSKRQIELLIEACSDVPNLEGIYIFGSSVSSTFTDTSDLDIAIKAFDKLDMVFLWNLKQRLYDLIKIEIDLIDMRAVDTVLQMQVVSTGKRIYSKNHTVSEFYDTLVYSQYLTLNEDRKEILQEVERSKKVYG